MDDLLIAVNPGSRLFKLKHVRPAVVADGLAELQIRWPSIPIVFCETRPLAEKWTYRYLAAALTWATTGQTAAERIGENVAGRPHRSAPTAATPTAARVRPWARAVGIAVSHRGRLRPDVWRNAHDH